MYNFTSSTEQAQLAKLALNISTHHKVLLLASSYLNTIELINLLLTSRQICADQAIQINALSIDARIAAEDYIVRFISGYCRHVLGNLQSGLLKHGMIYALINVRYMHGLLKKNLDYELHKSLDYFAFSKQRLLAIVHKFTTANHVERAVLQEELKYTLRIRGLMFFVYKLGCNVLIQDLMDVLITQHPQIFMLLLYMPQYTIDHWMFHDYLHLHQELGRRRLKIERLLGEDLDGLVVQADGANIKVHDEPEHFAYASPEWLINKLRSDSLSIYASFNKMLPFVLKNPKGLQIVLRDETRFQKLKKHPLFHGPNRLCSAWEFRLIVPVSETGVLYAFSMPQQLSLEQVLLQYHNELRSLCLGANKLCSFIELVCLVDGSGEMAKVLLLNIAALVELIHVHKICTLAELVGICNGSHELLMMIIYNYANALDKMINGPECLCTFAQLADFTAGNGVMACLVLEDLGMLSKFINEHKLCTFVQFAALARGNELMVDVLLSNVTAVLVLVKGPDAVCTFVQLAALTTGDAELARAVLINANNVIKLIRDDQLCTFAQLADLVNGDLEVFEIILNHYTDALPSLVAGDDAVCTFAELAALTRGNAEVVRAVLVNANNVPRALRSLVVDEESAVCTFAQFAGLVKAINLAGVKALLGNLDKLLDLISLYKVCTFAELAALSRSDADMMIVLLEYSGTLITLVQGVSTQVFTFADFAAMVNGNAQMARVLLSHAAQLINLIKVDEVCTFAELNKVVDGNVAVLEAILRRSDALYQLIKGTNAVCNIKQITAAAQGNAYMIKVLLQYTDSFIKLLKHAKPRVCTFGEFAALIKGNTRLAKILLRNVDKLLALINVHKVCTFNQFASLVANNYKMAEVLLTNSENLIAMRAQYGYSFVNFSETFGGDCKMAEQVLINLYNYNHSPQDSRVSSYGRC